MYQLPPVKDIPLHLWPALVPCQWGPFRDYNSRQRYKPTSKKAFFQVRDLCKYSYDRELSPPEPAMESLANCWE